MTLLQERSGIETVEGQQMQAPSRLLRLRALVITACVVAAMAGLGWWLWEDLTTRPVVYVVGDSITWLSEPSISADLSNAGYETTISATPGIKIGQSQAEISSLASKEPWAWIVELGTNDAGSRDTVWPEQFTAEWNTISSAQCVVYVTVSPRRGPVAEQINASIESLARTHSNVHVVDWGDLEYQNPAWVTLDGVHPTRAGQAVLAKREAQELNHSC